MSVIFDAMLVFEMPDRDGIRDLNRRLYRADTLRHQQFESVDMGHAGGSKVFCTAVYAAAFNHLIPNTVEDCIAATSWRDPETVMYVCDLGDYHQPDYGDDRLSLTARRVSEMLVQA